MKIISLSGGRQSVTLAAMSCLGELEKVDAAIFADTGWERQHTYEYMEKFIPWCAEHGLPVYTVSAGNIREDSLVQINSHIPWYIKSENGTGMLRRQCTGDYKIDPIQRKIRQLNGGISSPVELWIGFSVDEIYRVTDSRMKWIQHRFPLLEKRMRLSDCINWLRKRGLPIPQKSACVCCPFRKDDAWAAMAREATEEFRDACDFDEAMRNHPVLTRNLRNPPFLHRSLIPLRERPFEKNHGQLLLFEEEECQGGCWL